jgi:hypothetical protein
MSDSVNDDERAVSSIPLDGEDGEQIVIQQQNVGADNQVGGGEFKNVTHGRTPDEADAEQDALQREAPINEE